MPTKAVSYTQQPVIASDVIDVNLHAVAAGIRVTAIYNVRDQLGNVPARNTIVYTVANFAAFTGTDLLARINTQEGT